MLLGLKGIDHDLVFLAFDDEATPIGLVGSKQAPILVLPSGEAIAESMEIVRYVDENLGNGPLLKESANRPELEAWVKEMSTDFAMLVMPRFVKTPVPELARAVSRKYFQDKKEKMMGPFSVLISRTPELLERMNTMLERLEGLMQSDRFVSGDALSYDDVEIFPRLRNLTVVKGIKWPPKLRAYVDRYVEEADLRSFDITAN